MSIKDIPNMLILKLTNIENVRFIEKLWCFFYT